MKNLLTLVAVMGLTTGVANISFSQPRTSLSLADAAVVLDEGSRTLRISNATIEQARLLHTQARSALLPDVNLSFAYTFRDREVLFEMPNAYAPLSPYLDSVYNGDLELQQYLGDNPNVPDARAMAATEAEASVIQYRHDYRFGATVNQTILDFRVLSLLDQADIALEQAENGREQAGYQLYASLQALYFEALAAQRLVEVSEHNVELAEIASERATAALEEDVGNRFEENRAQIAVHTAQRDLEASRLAYSLATEALRAYLDLPEAFDVVEPPPLEPVETIDDVLGEALATHPGLEGVELSRRLSEERLDENRAQWWPTVHAQAQATTVRESAFSGDAFSWSLGIVLNWDVWDGGLRLAQRNTVELDIEANRLRLEQQHANVTSSVRNAWMRYETQAQLMDSVRAEAELASRNHWITQEAFDLGAATSLDVDIAQQQLYLAEVAQALSEVRLRALLYELHRLAGTLS